MVSKIKKNKLIVFSIALILIFTAALLATSAFAKNGVEKDVVKIASEKNQDEEEAMIAESAWGEGLYKDGDYIDKKIQQKVCDKYNLDYNTVKKKDMNREMFDYETALYWKAEYKDSPLLQKSAKGNGDFSSLESDVNDVFAFNGSKAIIVKICKQTDVDPEKASIDDLTIEQLMELQEKAIETSPHGK